MIFVCILGKTASVFLYMVSGGVPTRLTCDCGQNQRSVSGRVVNMSIDGHNTFTDKAEAAKFQKSACPFFFIIILSQHCFRVSAGEAKGRLRTFITAILVSEAFFEADKLGIVVCHYQKHMFMCCPSSKLARWS